MASTLPDSRSHTGVIGFTAGTVLFVTSVVILYFGREVFVPLAIALFLAFNLTPLVGFLRRWHVGPVPSVIVAVVLAVGFLGGLGSVIGMQIGELVPALPKYVTQIEHKVNDVKGATVGRVAHFGFAANSSTKAEIEEKQALSAVTPSDDDGSSKNGSSQSTPAASNANPIELAQKYLTPVLAPFFTLGIVFVVTLFALLQWEDLRGRLIRLLGAHDLRRTTVTINDAGKRLRRFFVTQLFINTVFGIVIGIGLLIIGVPNPVLWGILSALLRFVPYIGSLLSAVLPLTLAAGVEPGWTMVLWTLALYGILETLTGQIVEPLVYGHSTGLSPFSVIVAAIFWSWVWGPMGLLMSTPLTLCLVVIGRHIPQLQFLDLLLGDQVPLTPVQHFYQRSLAGDVDETQDQAETFLEKNSLSSYYDEVTIKSLKLAASDIQRGKLDDAHLDRLKTTVHALVSAVDRYVKDPIINEESIEHEILCVAGRGPLDETAATMLIQLLRKQGQVARLAPHDEVSAAKIDSFNMDKIAFVCIAFVEFDISPAHLRFLIRRIREKVKPGTPLLVGFWSPDELGLVPDEAKAALGTDYITNSFAEALKICRERLPQAKASDEPGQV